MLTNEQKMIIDAIKMSSYPIVKVIAFAGTGKTFTLTKLAQEVKGKKLYLAFNKSIVEEANIKFKGTNTHIVTTHSLAHKYIIGEMKYTLKSKYSPNEIMKIFNINEYWVAKKALSLVENFCNSDYDKFEDSVNFNLENIKVKKLAKDIMNNMALKKIDVTFSSMLKLFAVFINRGKIKLPKYRLVMLDEAQDTNDVTLSIFNAINAEQKILVGDPHQQIYSFRGGLNALDKIEAKEFVLSNSFRYTKRIGDKATDFLSIFKNENRKITGGAENRYKYNNRAIIARGNIKLIEKMNELLNKEKRFKTARGPYSIFGLPINLLKIITAFEKGYDNFEKNSLDIDKEYMYLNYFVNDYLKYCKDMESKGLLTSISSIEDWIPEYINDKNDEISKSIAFLKQYSKRLNYIYAKVIEYNKSKDINLYLTTAHTSKGLEWDSVELLGDFPGYKIFKEWFEENDININRDNLYDIFFDECIKAGGEKNQKYIDELNLYYVAITRAKYHLIDNTDFNPIPIDREGLNLKLKDYLKKNKKKRL